MTFFPHTDCYASALSGSLTSIVRWNGQEKAPTA